MAKKTEVKQAWANLFVQLLHPVAATVDTEVNVPVLRQFIEMLYQYALDQAKKSKYWQVRLAPLEFSTSIMQ